MICIITVTLFLPSLGGNERGGANSFPEQAKQ